MSFDWLHARIIISHLIYAFLITPKESVWDVPKFKILNHIGFDKRCFRFVTEWMDLTFKLFLITQFLSPLFLNQYPTATTFRQPNQSLVTHNVFEMF